MINSECERFVCDLKSTCRMAYLGKYFCSHYCQTNNCYICQKKEDCKLCVDDRKAKNDVFRTS